MTVDARDLLLVYIAVLVSLKFLYDVSLAERIAANSRIDLRRLERLIASGATPLLAYRIEA